MKINKKYLQALLFIGIMAPSVILTAARSVQLNTELTESASSRRQSIADLSAVVLQEKFSHIKDLSLSFATRVQFRKMIARGEWDEAVSVLKSVPQKDFPFIDRVFLTDAKGTLMADYPEIPGVRGQNFSDRDWYRSVVKENETIISEIYRRAAEPRYNVISVATPIHEPGADRIVGFLVMQIRLSTVLGWARSIDTGDTGVVYFVDKSGNTVQTWPEMQEDEDVPNYSSFKPVQEAIAGYRGVRIERHPEEGILYVAAVSPVKSEHWAAVIAQPKSKAFGMKKRILRSFWISSIILILLNAGLAILILKLQGAILRSQQERARSEAEREQLELFAFVASHDLQEPLNKIMSFGSLLRETSGPAMSEASRHDLDRMLAAAHRMSRMIEDIRSFSTIRQKSSREHVGLSLILANILDELRDPLALAGGAVKFGQLPEVFADAGQLTILFRNLITNAIKYRKKEGPLKIEIDAEADRSGLVRVRVRDNGIGFDEKYLDQIFVPFKRLHTSAQYEGTGLGLAICHRIAVLNGGSITAHSKPGEGAVFTVSIPARKL